MKRWAHRIQWSLGIASFIGIAAFMLWLAVNVWIQPEVSPKWTETDLDLPEEFKENAWRLLPQTDGAVPVALAALLPDPISAVLPSVVRDTTDLNIDDYWQQVAKMETSINTQEEARSQALAFFESLTARKQFIDVDPPDLSVRSASILYLFDLHHVMWSELLWLSHQGQWESAYEKLLQALKLDTAWLYSARSLFSHLVAIECLRGNLTVFRLMLTRHDPTNPNRLIDWAESVDAKKMNFKRALIFEYLTQQKTIADILKQHSKDGKFSPWPATFFNPSLISKDMNERFTELAAYDAKPKSIPDSPSQLFDEQHEKLEQGLWWLHNPGGKILQKLLQVDVLNMMRNFYLHKGAVISQLKTIFIPDQS